MSFFLIMVIASALSLLRGFVVATTLTPETFGIYAMVVSAGGFASGLLGAGRIEATMKTFPRAWMGGFPGGVCAHADALTRTVALRGAIAGILGVVAILVVARWSLLLPATATVGVAVAVAAIGIQISAVRASGNLRSLGVTTFCRSALALIACWFGTIILGWLGAVLGEVAAAVVGILVAQGAARRAAAAVKEKDLVHNLFGADETTATGGRYLLFALLLTSTAAYLDRLYVGSLLGSAAAGRYGFLMLFVTGAAVVAGVVVQKVGPAIVRAQHQGTKVSELLMTVLKWGAIQAALVVAGMACVGLIASLQPFEELTRRYGLDGDALLAATALAAAQWAVLLDWILMAIDRERIVFLSAGIYFFCILAMAAWFATAGASIAEIVGALAAARFIQVVAQVTFILASSATLGGKGAS